jgi:hypothetical protein
MEAILLACEELEDLEADEFQDIVDVDLMEKSDGKK